MELELQKRAVIFRHRKRLALAFCGGVLGGRGRKKQTNKRRTSTHQFLFYSVYVCVCTCWGSVLPSVPAVLISHNPAVGCAAECDRLPAGEGGTAAE